MCHKLVVYPSAASLRGSQLGEASSQIRATPSPPCKHMPEGVRHCTFRLFRKRCNWCPDDRNGRSISCSKSGVLRCQKCSSSLVTLQLSPSCSSEHFGSVLHCLHLRQLASALFNISELFSAIALALESRAATCTIMPALGAVPLIRDTWAIADLLVCDAVLCHGLSTYQQPRFYDTSMGHYTWYLVLCNERSLSDCIGQKTYKSSHGLIRLLPANDCQLEPCTSARINKQLVTMLGKAGPQCHWLHVR
jgi:hypothetical protein